MLSLTCINENIEGLMLHSSSIATAGKKVLQPCTIQAMHIIIGLLGFHQSLMPKSRHHWVGTTLVYTIMSTRFIIKDQIIKELPVLSKGPH